MSLSLKHVRLGNTSVNIPVYENKQRHAEKTVLITGGMDGDEYAGIEAAYRLITYYSKMKVSFNLIIIPIVNIPGYEGHVSYNPLDNKFPKLVYPGKEKGTATDQLLNWLKTTYINQADLWIDLHSGALIESLYPFVWSYQTSSKEINNNTLRCLSSFKKTTIIYETAHRFSKAEQLSQNNTTYLLFESGQLGERVEKDIQRHIDWTNRAIESYINPVPTPIKSLVVYKSIDMIEAKLDGSWHPVMKHEQAVEKGSVIGTEISYDGKKRRILRSTHSGISLWRRESRVSKKKEIIQALAYNSITLTSQK